MTNNTSNPITAVPANLTLLFGLLSEQRSLHDLPDARHRAAFSLTSPPGGDRWSVPVVVEGTNADLGRLALIPADTEVLVVGRVRQRFFRTGGTTAARTEVVAEHVVPTRRRRQVERLLDQVRRSLGAG